MSGTGGDKWDWQVGLSLRGKSVLISLEASVPGGLPAPPVLQHSPGLMETQVAAKPCSLSLRPHPGGHTGVRCRAVGWEAADEMELSGINQLPWPLIGCFV